MTLKELKKEIEDGVIVAGSTSMGGRISKEEMMAAAMRVWELGVIEEALGDDAPFVLPEVIRLVELRARVPRYQREMLRELARREGTSVDHVLTREAEDGVRVCRGAGGGAGVRDGDAVAGGLMAEWSPTDHPPTLSSTNKLG